MRRMCRSANPTVLTACTLLLFCAGFAIGGWTANRDSPSASQSTSAPAARLFELRVYTAAAGKMPALHERFRTHTLRLFARHGIESVGYWTADAGPDGAEKLYYIVAYPDRASREKMLIQGIAVDPEFRHAVAESEKAGPLTTAIDSILLRSTDYSPLQ